MGDIHAIAIRRLASQTSVSTAPSLLQKNNQQEHQILEEAEEKKHPKLFYDTTPYIIGFSVLFSIVQSILGQIK